METEPWLRFWGALSRTRNAAFIATLSAIGLRVRLVETLDAHGAGLVCFETLDDGLLRFIADVTQVGDTRVIAVRIATTRLSSAAVWRLLQAGAADVLEGDCADELAEPVKARFVRWNDMETLLHSPHVLKKLIGGSACWRATLRQIVEVAHFTDACVLLMGESGTGKELLARLVHDISAGASGGSLSVLDCTTVTPELAGSEFFGHERGAFTSAVASREGAFSLANGGTLFLDEVGELPITLQAQLLRVIQEGVYKRVGSSAWQRTKFRLVCATNRDLPEMVKHGEFRSDLYYRIATWMFRVPPLRERRDDILPLARHFLRSLRPDLASTDFAPSVEEFLLSRDYPGNVRELKQLITRIASRHVGSNAITVGGVPQDERPRVAPDEPSWRNSEFDHCVRCALLAGVGLKEIGEIAKQVAVRIAIDQAHGNVQVAARCLHVTERAVQLRRACQRSSTRGAGASNQ